MGELKSKVSNIREALKTLQKEAVDSIENIREDNPEINKISDSPKVFTVKASQLCGSWSPEFYDFSQQYDFIIKLANKQSVSVFLNSLEKIVNTGRYDYMRFHPQVIEKIKTLI